MITTEQQQELEALGFGGSVLELEKYVMLLQDAAADGEPMVDDGLYDRHVRLLRALKPESEALHRNWEIDYGVPDVNLDKYLNSMGMKSISTCVTNKELERVGQEHSKLGLTLEYFASVKLNGHAFRAVYKNGKLTKATLRGRYKVGREILRHAKLLLPNEVECWSDIDITEVRGELVMPVATFKEKFADFRKSPLSCVTSLSRESASDSEIKNLRAVCYKVFQDEFEFDTLEEEFNHLQECGFEVPAHRKFSMYTQPEMFAKQINSFISDLGMQYKSGQLTPFDCDGVVIAINNNKKFYSLGENGNSWWGNLAVKMGVWECSHYISKIESIEWCPGKKYITPKAHIVPTRIASGQTVYVVPLYNVGNIIRMNLIPGEEIHFRAGGETGVQLLTPSGESVTTL